MIGRSTSRWCDRGWLAAIASLATIFTCLLGSIAFQLVPGSGSILYMYDTELGHTGTTTAEWLWIGVTCTLVVILPRLLDLIRPKPRAAGADGDYQPSPRAPQPPVDPEGRRRLIWHIYLITNAAWFLAALASARFLPSTWEQLFAWLGGKAAWPGMWNLAFNVVPVQRTCQLLGTSHKETAYLHIWMGHAIFFWLMLHTVGLLLAYAIGLDSLAGWRRAMLPYGRLYSEGVVNFTGFLSLGFYIALWITSLQAFRLRFYSGFEWCHVAFAAMFVLFGNLHDYNTLQFVQPGIALWMTDRLMRQYTNCNAAVAPTGGNRGVVPARTGDCNTDGLTTQPTLLDRVNKGATYSPLTDPPEMDKFRKYSIATDPLMDRRNAGTTSSAIPTVTTCEAAETIPSPEEVDETGAPSSHATFGRMMVTNTNSQILGLTLPIPNEWRSSLRASSSLSSSSLFVYVKHPSLSRYESHPFSISSMDLKRGTYSLHIKALGDWTTAFVEELHQRLRFVSDSAASADNSSCTDMASESSQVAATVATIPPIGPNVGVRSPTDGWSLELEGPYSGPDLHSILDDYASCVFIAGGVGITGLCETIVRRHHDDITRMGSRWQNGQQQQTARTTLIWIIRTHDEFNFLSQELFGRLDEDVGDDRGDEEVQSILAPAAANLTIKVFITQECPSSVPTTLGSEEWSSNICPQDRRFRSTFIPRIQTSGTENLERGRCWELGGAVASVTAVALSFLFSRWMCSNILFTVPNETADGTNLGVDSSSRYRHRCTFMSSTEVCQSCGPEEYNNRNADEEVPCCTVEVCYYGFRGLPVLLTFFVSPLLSYWFLGMIKAVQDIRQRCAFSWIHQFWTWTLRGPLHLFTGYRDVNVDNLDNLAEACPPPAATSICISPAPTPSCVPYSCASMAGRPVAPLYSEPADAVGPSAASFPPSRRPRGFRMVVTYERPTLPRLLAEELEQCGVVAPSVIDGGGDGGSSSSGSCSQIEQGRDGIVAVAVCGSQSLVESVRSEVTQRNSQPIGRSCDDHGGSSEAASSSEAEASASSSRPDMAVTMAAMDDSICNNIGEHQGRQRIAKKIHLFIA